jgi:hypothetical protein
MKNHKHCKCNKKRCSKKKQFTIDDIHNGSDKVLSPRIGLHEEEIQKIMQQQFPYHTPFQDIAIDLGIEQNEQIKDLPIVMIGIKAVHEQENNVGLWMLSFLDMNADDFTVDEEEHPCTVSYNRIAMFDENGIFNNGLDKPWVKEIVKLIETILN